MVPEYIDTPIFPLPNVTFFPKTVLPLHIFEPRYRQMVKDCLNGDRLIGVALLREGWQKDYFGHPPIHRTFGVGKIVDYDELDDGRYNIRVEGLWRVRLVTEYPTKEYRTGRSLVLQDRPLDDIRKQLAEARDELYGSCQELQQLLPQYAQLIQSAWSLHPHPAVAVDLLAATVVLDAYDRQCILEETDPIRRMRLVSVQVNSIIHELEKRGVEDDFVENEILGEEDY